MPGFLPSPEKDYLQATLWLPAIKKAVERSGDAPLRILCLPGRECRFLTTLLDKQMTTVNQTVCLERDSTEALIIRGILADHTPAGVPVTANIIAKSVYNYLTDDAPTAIEQRFQVVDLDVYGNLGNSESDVLETIGAAINVQHRANVKDWLLLVTTEVASKREPGIVANLRANDARIIAEDPDTLRAVLGDQAMADESVGECVRRFMANAGIMIARAALPNYTCATQGSALIYRGTSDYGERRALMGGVALRLTYPDKPLAGMGARRGKIEREATISLAKQCASCRGILREEDGKVKRSDDLGAVVGT